MNNYFPNYAKSALEKFSDYGKFTFHYAYFDIQVWDGDRRVCIITEGELLRYYQSEYQIQKEMEHQIMLYISFMLSWRGKTPLLFG